jgi:hypothetical protein
MHNERYIYLLAFGNCSLVILLDRLLFFKCVGCREKCETNTYWEVIERQKLKNCTFNIAVRTELDKFNLVFRML